MSLSMHEASASVFVRQFASLAKLLEKGEAFAKAQGLDEAELIEARLAPDMHPLPRQIQFASDSAKFAIARLAGVDAPPFEDNETSFAELQARIAKTVAFIESVPADKVDGSEDREVVLKLPNQEMRFTGRDYLLKFALPNFFFHVTVAYSILRHKGVEIGKRDYLGA